MIFLNKTIDKNIDGYNIFDVNSDNMNNIGKNKTNNIDNNQNFNDQNTTNNNNSIELKVQKYEENNQNLIIQLKNILGKKYNTLTYHEKYILIRYLLEDIDKNIKENFVNQSNSDKKVFINLILKYYRENIKYTGNNLNEFDYYYITLFTFFLNAKILFPQQAQYYTDCMLQMINNRINKINELWNNDKDSKLNDLEIIRKKIEYYKKMNKDVYENYKNSFTKEEFELMSLSQKCTILRVIIDGILKDEYNNAKSKEIQKQIIIKINKIYENISKLNNFSYDWFISVYNIFENHIKIQKLIEEYEKSNNDLINNIIDSIGNTEYNNLSLVKKYALLKCCFCDLSKKAYSLLNEKSRKNFICDIYDDIKKYFYDSYSLLDIEEVSNVLITCYNQELKNIEKTSELLDKNAEQQTLQQTQQQVQQQTQQQVQQQTQQQVQQQTQQQVQQQKQQQNIKIDFKLAMPSQDDKIIYFVGYKNNDNKNITLYKMSKEKFNNNKEEFIKKYQILTYNDENKNLIPIIISEKYYNEYCNGSKNTCLSMIKEGLQDIKLSNIPDKIQAFKNVSTKK